MKQFVLGAALALFTVQSASAQESMMRDIPPDYVDRLVSVARDYFPKFKANNARVETARLGVSRAKLGWFDFLQLSYWYNPSASRQESGANPYYYNGTQIGIIMNVGNVLQKPAVVKLARSEYNTAIYERETSDLNLETQVRQRYYAYLRQLNLLKLRTNSEADATDMLKGLKFKFEQGQIPFDTYSQAQITHGGHAQDRISAEADMLIAKSSLEELLGTKLENIH